jgi:hypothetical protein
LLVEVAAVLRIMPTAAAAAVVLVDTVLQQDFQ